MFVEMKIIYVLVIPMTWILTPTVSTNIKMKPKLVIHFIRSIVWVVDMISMEYTKKSYILFA